MCMCPLNGLNKLQKYNLIQGNCNYVMEITVSYFCQMLDVGQKFKLDKLTLIYQEV